MKLLRADIERLENSIKIASDSYYNSGTAKVDGKKISDAEFDSWVDKLREVAPSSPVLKNIGAAIPTKKKVKLPVHMGSLDKIKPETADSWLNSTTGPYCVSDKLDGVSILIVYDNNLRKAYTRGDGTYGQDISFLLDHLKVPDNVPVDYMEIRGEMIISSANFKKWEGKFENPRNMVAGITNRKDIHTGIKDIDVIVYEVLEPRMKPSKSMSYLKKLKFNTVWNGIYQSLTAKSLSMLLKERKIQTKYDIDGLVITKDVTNPINTEGNPKYARAFKELSVDSIVKTTVVQVEWNVSKLGAIKPRVEIKPVRVSGVTITWVTGNNAKFIVDNGIGPNAIVEISRRGDVIPKIENVLKSVKPQLPDLDSESYEWNNTKVDFVLVDKSGNEAIIVKQLLSFFRILGVENFSKGLVSRFYEHGLKTVSAIVKAKPKDFMKIDGIQERMANKIYENIQAKIHDVPLAVLMSASGCFPNLAETSIKVILKAIPEILDSYTDLNKSELVSKIASIKGYSTNTATVFVKGIYAFSKWYIKHNYITYEKPASTKVTTELPLAGQQFVFTGFRDSVAQQKIEDLGGSVGSGVSKKTTILVVKDKSSESEKMTKAKQLNVKILDKVEFNKWLARY